MVRSRKFRTLEVVYKHAAKVSKPRITPILEGKCRMRGPQDESASEHELDTVCSRDRSLEVNMVKPIDGCTSTNASKKCNNNKTSCNTGIHHNTDDKQMIGKKIVGKELACKHTTGKSASKDSVEREEMSGRMKASISSSAQRRKRNKTKETDICTLTDYGLKAEMQTTSTIQQSENPLVSTSASQSNNEEKIASCGRQSEESEKPLVTTSASQSNNEEKIASCGRKSEETHNKCFVEEPAAIMQSNETLNNEDTKVCHDYKDIKDQEEVEMELPRTKSNDASNIDLDSVATSLNRSSLDTCTVEPVLLLNEAKESKGSPELGVPTLFHYLNGSELDNHISGCENSAGVSEIYGIGEVYNAEDMKESPIANCSSKLENIDDQAATQTKSHLAENVHSLSVNGTEPVDLSVESSPFDHSISSSSKKRESSNIHISEENVSQEAVCSFPLSVTPGHSSVTSANQSVTTAKEIEAHSSCQHEEDFSFTCATICMESSSTKDLVVEDAKYVSPILLVSLAGSQEDHKNDSLKRSELDQDSHIGEATNKVGLSDLVSSSVFSLPSEDTEKSCEPFSGEDDVKVCDVCGDSGFEEMLAICTLCKDGAEHIYCMQPMLDEVPEGDWLCEACKLKQNVNVPRAETHPSLPIISKPPSLTSRKDNFYSTARSRLSAKLEKKKFAPERKRALKGLPSSLVTTKRQAEDSDPGPPTKKMAVETPNSNICSLSSNVKAVISRENSFQAIDKVKTLLDVASTGNPSSSSNHESGKSSPLHGSSSPKLTVNAQLLKNNSFSSNSRTADSSAFTGASKAGSIAPFGGLTTHTVKNTTDMTSHPSTTQRLNSVKKSSATVKVIKDFHEASLHNKADMEKQINTHAVGISTKVLKCNTKTDSPTISEPRSTSDVHNPEQKKASGKVTKDGSGPPRNVMTKSLSMSRDTIAVRAEKLEKIFVDDIDAKPVLLPIKVSSKSRTGCSEGKMAVSPTLVIPNSNNDLYSSRFSGLTQSKASPSKLQGVMAKKLQHSASTETSHKSAPEKSKEQFPLETTKSMTNISSSYMEDDKRSISNDDNVVPKVITSHLDKISGNLDNKAVPNDYPHDENKKMGNFRKFPSSEWSSTNHLGAVGSTRCYKCKEIGHSAQSCTNRSLAEAGTTSLRVFNLIASAGRSSGEMPHIIGVKSSSIEEIAPSSNYKASVSDQNSGRRQVQFESEKDHAQQPNSGLPRQVPNNKETSYVDRTSNSIKILKETTDLNKHHDNKTSENCQLSTCIDVGGGTSSIAQILTSRPSKSSVVDPTSTSPMIVEEKLSHIGCNEKKKSEVGDSPKYSFQKGLSEGESSFDPGDSSQITAVINQHYPAEVSVVAIRGNSMHGVDASLERSNHQSMKLTGVQSRSSSQLETTKATSLPERNFLWQGGFQVQSKEDGTSYFDGIQAHASTSAAPKFLDAAKKFSSILRLEEAPLHSSLSTQFRHNRPSDDSITLYFFAKDHDSYVRPYKKLLERMLKNDVALRGNLDAVELLVFPSNKLSEKSQCWNGLLFLWGVFRERKSSCIELSTYKGESIQGGLAKRDMLGSINLNVLDSQQANLSSLEHRLSALGDMDIVRSGNENSNALDRTITATGDHWLPPVSSQGEGLNGNSHASNIKNLSFHEDKEFHSIQKIEKKAGEQLLAKKHSMVSLFESNEQPHSKGSHFNRSNRPDFSPAFENSTAHKLNATDGITSEKSIPPQVGLVGSVQYEGASCSYVSLQTEKTNPENCSALPFSSAICSSPIERNAHSCDAFRIDNFHSEAPCGQTNIIKGKKRLRDFEYETLMERTKDTVMGSAHGIKHPCISRSLSSPQLVVQSHSPPRQIYEYDCQHSRTHSPDLDHTKQIHLSPGWQVPKTIPDFVGSSYERSFDVAVDGKEVQRKFNNSEVQGKKIGKEQDPSGTRFGKPKKLPVQSYHITDLNQVADFDPAVEFSDPSVQQHIQPQNLDGLNCFPQGSRVIERVFFPRFEFGSSNMSSKPSEQWQIQLSSKQESSEPSSTIQLISTEEDKQQLDLNIPNLELGLGGKMTSSNPGALPTFVKLLNQTSGQLPKSPIRSSSVQGIENGSSLALSLAFPSQNDQTAKSMKEEYTKPVNCVNTSFCLFGHRVNG